MPIQEVLHSIRSGLPPNVKLVAVSKTKPVSDILEAYNSGQRIFGENKAQEMIAKSKDLPGDIQWHLIGHLQTNKVRSIVQIVDLIHSVDSFKLLQIIDKEASGFRRVVNCLLQFYIATEETKFGLNRDEAHAIFASAAFQSMKHVKICGVMGMASFTRDKDQIRNEFRLLRSIFNEFKSTYFKMDPDFREISMGMSDDYGIAIEEGSTMVRLGSVIFGKR